MILIFLIFWKSFKAGEFLIFDHICGPADPSYFDLILAPTSNFDYYYIGSPQKKLWIQILYFSLLFENIPGTDLEFLLASFFADTKPFAFQNIFFEKVENNEDLSLIHPFYMIGFPPFFWFCCFLKAKKYLGTELSNHVSF